jgi:hypothetical protein
VLGAYAERLRGSARARSVGKGRRVEARSNQCKVAPTQMAGYGWLLLLGECPTPCPRAYANHAREDFGEVALIGKTADQGHVQQRQSAVAQLLLGSLDSTREKPVVRRYPHGAAKRAREVAHGQAALLSHLPERYTTIEVGAENFLGASHLPRREPAPDQP